MDSFPKRLRAAREQAKMSQSHLASCLGVKRQTVGNWETGLARPRAALVPLLAETLGTTAAYLFGETDDPTSSKSQSSLNPLEQVAHSLRIAGATEDDIDLILQLLRIRKRLRRTVEDLEDS